MQLAIIGVLLVFGFGHVGAPLVSLAAAQTCYRQAVSMRFKPVSAGPPFSFIDKEGVGGIIKRSEALPRIIVQVLDSDGAVDRSANSIEITASSSANLNREGVTVKVFRGEAHFTRIILEGLASVMALTFTAKAQDNLVSAGVQGATLRTRNFTVLDRDPGMWNLSFIPYANSVLRAGQPLDIVSGALVPPIKVSIITASYQVYPTQTQMTTTNVTAIATVDSPLATITGNVALAYEGVFLFENMVITTSASTLPPIRFTVIEGYAGEGSLSIATGPITVKPATDHSHIAFLDESRSFIYGQGVSIFAVNGIPLPPIRIGVFDTVYRTSPPVTGLVITASCDRARLRGFIVGVIDGVATFDSLTFTDVLDVGDGTDKPFVITFTAGNQDDLPLKGDTIVTGAIFVNTQIRPAASIRFLQSPLDSLFTARDQKKQVVFYLRLDPVRIEVLDNANRRDTTSAMTFTAVAMPSNMLEGTTHLGTLSGGVATFAALQFPSRASAWLPRLTFTARDNTTARFSLVTGYITVTNAQPNFGLRFNPYGASAIGQEGDEAVATIGVPMPPIILELVSSAGTLDLSSSEVGITATAEGAELSGSFVRVSNGVATFSSLTFASETVGSYVLTFTAGTEGNHRVQGKAVHSGTVNVAAAETPAFGIRFAREESYFPFEGCQVPVTSGATIPPVIVELVTSSGALDVVTETVRISCAPTSGRWGAGVVSEVLVTEGRAVFSSLALVGAFSPAVACCASSTDPNEPHPVGGSCVQTGSLTFNQVAGSVGKLLFLNSSAIGGREATLRYLKNASIDSGAIFPAAIGIANTAGQWLPASEAAIDVSVSCSVGLRPPLTVRMESHDGLWYAYFGQLQFSGDVPPGVSPIITFTAPDMQPITTGLVSVTGSGTADGVDVTVDLYFSFRSFDFSAWRAELCARLNIDTDRIIARRIDEGGGQERTEPTEETLYTVTPSWYGTRLDLRVLEPLPTSRVTKRAADVAALILALKTDCQSGALRLRKAYLSAADTACDFGLFDEQQNGARQCIETQGKDGYCRCHVPMFAAVGVNCLGYSPLTELCLETLIPYAQCGEEAIATVCNQLVFGEVPRTAVAGSGLFLFLFAPPLAYLYLTGYFTRLSRPNTRHVRLPHAEQLLGEDAF